MPRFHCEFLNCTCDKYILSKNKLCFCCRHANIWHSKKPITNDEGPPSDSYLQFTSSRKKARAPKYVSDKTFPKILIPTVLPLAVATPVLNPVYCETFELLDV